MAELNGLLPLRSLLLYRPLSDGSAIKLEAGAGPGIEAFENDRHSPIPAGEHPCWTSHVEGFPQTVSTSSALPQELTDFEGQWHTEVELLDIIHEEGCALGHILRASSDDRDWYTALWPYEWKRIYLQHMRALHGWAMYLIRPQC